MHVLQTAADLDAALLQSQARPIVIFKHSSTCGTSVMAHQEVAAVVAGAPWAEVFVVSVHAARGLSQDMATRFGVRHESPQALVIHRGVVFWHASHFRVTREAVAAALDRAASAADQ